MHRLTRGEKRSLLVRPERSTISQFCTQLTTLRPDMFDNAMRFPEATRLLKKEYDSKQRLWASWGDYDRRQFERVCELIAAEGLKVERGVFGGDMRVELVNDGPVTIVIESPE